ncbi:Uma2 family endonuclease [Spirosoma sp. HMF4905]|uniref:Uma2 family endonuclease n=1 Tax=Spirosoma arboris TaxID=2682092 RepID=A0A7K1SFZ1_9BACT|nr:Uma2 family endonuclease [Spirosoma arboris]MVM32628.1 Uma2 family endonuclease [Spirosoma arboris]
MVPVEEKSKRGKSALTPEQRRQRQLLLGQLVYEMEDEKPVYYAGYRDVLSGLKEPEEIMGSSGLQSFLVEIVQRFLFTHPFNTRLRIMASEVGVQIRKKEWRSCDIAIYEKERLKNYVFTNKYMDIPPDYVIEVDTKADLTKYQYQHDYFIKKTRELHEFGVKKVIWIFTENIPVIWESESADAIIIRDGWNHDVTITEGLTFNLGELYAEAQRD